MLTISIGVATIYGLCIGAIIPVIIAWLVSLGVGIFSFGGFGPSASIKLKVPVIVSGIIGAIVGLVLDNIH